MRSIWTESDIDAGVYIIRDDSKKNSSDMAFARTVVWKIGYSDASPKEWGKISVLTDGCYIPIAKDRAEFAEFLNKDLRGYRPITKQEYMRLLESTEQGFI